MLCALGMPRPTPMRAIVEKEKSLCLFESSSVHTMYTASSVRCFFKLEFFFNDSKVWCGVMVLVQSSRVGVVPESFTNFLQRNALKSNQFCQFNFPYNQ